MLPNLRPNLGALALCIIVALSGRTLRAQTYPPPTNGEYGGDGPAAVAVNTFTNPTYPTANGRTLTVSIYHPNATIDPTLPTIFVAHGFTNPIGSAGNYEALLHNLASRGYNVVFSPYEGGSNPDNTKRFGELTTGFEAAAVRYGLNTAQVGFVGHSYGAGLLPAIIQHEMMGLADRFREGHEWGAAAAFMFSMAPGYALDGGGDTGVAYSQAIVFPPGLNVVEQVYGDDSVVDPRLAIDIFDNLTTPASQKDFLTVYSDSHGTPAQVANHNLPNSLDDGRVSEGLQAWAILRHLDALAAYTFTGDVGAGRIALGNGAAAQTNEGVWSDGVAVAPMGATDFPDETRYRPGPYALNRDDPANPRRRFPLNGPPPPPVVSIAVGEGGVKDGQASFTITRAGDLSATVTVSYQAVGSAVAGQDYLPLTGAKKIKAGNAGGSITVSVLPGATGKLKLKLLPASGYTVGTSDQAKILLNAN